MHVLFVTDCFSYLNTHKKVATYSTYSFLLTRNYESIPDIQTTERKYTDPTGIQTQITLFKYSVEPFFIYTLVFLYTLVWYICMYIYVSEIPWLFIDYFISRFTRNFMTKLNETKFWQIICEFSSSENHVIAEQI